MRWRLLSKLVNVSWRSCSSILWITTLPFLPNAPRKTPAAISAPMRTAAPSTPAAEMPATSAGPSPSAPAAMLFSKSAMPLSSPPSSSTLSVISVWPVRASCARCPLTVQMSGAPGVVCCSATLLSGPLGAPGSATACGCQAIVSSTSVGIASPQPTAVGLSHCTTSSTRYGSVGSRRAGAAGLVESAPGISAFSCAGSAWAASLGSVGASAAGVPPTA